MERNEKDQMVDELKASLVTAQSLVLTDFRGVTVEKDTELRNRLRKAGCRYRVVKNTLLSRAVKGTPLEVIDKLLEGPTAIAYSSEDAAAPAKVLTEFVKDAESLTLKGGYVEGQLLDAKGVEGLAKMPGKDQMRATFLAMLQAVPQAFLRLTSAAPTNFLYLLRAREAAGGKSATGE